MTIQLLDRDDLSVITERPRALLEPFFQGGMAIFVDPLARQGRGRGILAAAARTMTERQATLMATEARGLLSVAIDGPAAMRLGLRYMAGSVKAASDEPIFLCSVEAASGIGTGISAHDRALTIRIIGSPNSSLDDLITPGHVMPLLIRRPLGPAAALPEIAFAALSSWSSSGPVAWTDILDDDGEVASLDECVRLARRMDLPVAGRAAVRALSARR